MLIRAAVSVPERGIAGQKSPALLNGLPAHSAQRRPSIASSWLTPLDPHMPALIDSLLLLFFSITFLPPSTYAGCYQRRLCCDGRNVSCSAIEDGIAHLPTVAYPDTEQPRRIGQLKLPEWFDIEGSGSGGEPYEFVTESPAMITKRETASWIEEQPSNTSPAFSVQHLLLGLPYFPNGVFSEHVRYHGGQPILRYSLLNQHIPLTIEEEVLSNYAYLAAGETACYCDAECVRLGDCCSDYTFVCPPSECYVSTWSYWSSCEPNDGAKCGSGVRLRSRTILREERFGGQLCPPLTESAVCFRPCAEQSEEAVLTTALLLPYRYADKRAGVTRNNIYWDLPEVVKKVEKLSQYCVVYEIGWANRNCVEKQAKTSLTTGKQICAECQPEAQMHRDDQRCSSDLRDGQLGFWKLIGPQSFNFSLHHTCISTQNKQQITQSKA
uniref:SMB domain-containing protein n=1 Tax=Plectus sambesii TaxID=2011161 RepID=A0A914VYA5_9BILA